MWIPNIFQGYRRPKGGLCSSRIRYRKARSRGSYFITYLQSISVLDNTVLFCGNLSTVTIILVPILLGLGFISISAGHVSLLRCLSTNLLQLQRHILQTASKSPVFLKMGVKRVIIDGHVHVTSRRVYAPFALPRFD